MSAILSSKYKYKYKYKYEYKNKNNEINNYYNISMHYSSENLGKIHYYLLMMHLKKENIGYLKPTLYEELTEITENIWNSILEDESVNKIELDSDEDYEFDSILDIEIYAYSKDPDFLYIQTNKKRIIFFRGYM